MCRIKNTNNGQNQYYNCLLKVYIKMRLYSTKSSKLGGRQPICT